MATTQTTKKRPSAPEFYNHVLTALHELGPGEAHQCNDVVRKAIKLSPYTLCEFGTNKKGEYWVRNWVMAAWRDCRYYKWGDNVKKGWWQINAAGIAKIGQGTAPPAAVEDEGTPVLAYTMGAGSTLVLCTAPTVAETEAYHADPYIRSVAVTATRCFGRYAPRSSTCTTCTLAAHCQQAFGLHLLASAAQLENNEEISAKNAKARLATKTRLAAKNRLAAKTPLAAKPVTTDSDVDDLLDDLLADEVPARTQANLAVLSNHAIEIKAEYTVVCDHCDGEIKTGQKAFYDPDKGFYHVGCCAK